MSLILIVEDDPAILRGLGDNLRFESHEVLTATDGETGYRLVHEKHPDLVILDLMLPAMSGYELCRKFRGEGFAAPILMLTARGEEVDRVRGLDLGADDYVTKPFSVPELLARVRALLRRAHPARNQPDELRIGDVVVDFRRYEARKAGEPFPMTRKEFGLLHFLATRRGEVVTRDELLNEVWGFESYPVTRTVDNHIASLRAKLEDDPARPRHLLTVHGVGYKLIFMVLAAAFLSAAVPAARAQSGYDLFQQALVKERVEGKLEEAIALYEAVARQFPQDRDLAAEALLEMGRCQERKLAEAEARSTYERLLREYGDQADEATRARSRLQALRRPSLIRRAMLARQVWAGPDVDTEGTPSPDASFLPYVDWETGDLAVRDLRSGRSRRLTRKGTWDESQAYALNSVVSPDSREIAYAWFDGGAGFELRVVGQDGTGDRVLLRTEKASYIHPYEWSRNGEGILALLHRDEVGPQIVLVSARGGAVTVVETRQREASWGMSLSPDGRFLAYDAVSEQGTSEREIHVRAIGSGEVSPLVEHPGQDAFPLWSPDGRHVVFISDRTGDPGIWIQRVSDGKAEGTPELVKQDVGRSYPIGLTPDGSYYYALQAGLRDVYLASIDPGTGEVVSDPKPVSRRFLGSKGQADFSPDGQYLVHVTEVDSLPWYLGARWITIRDLETGNERELRPSLQAIFRPRWSRDGNFLFCRGRDEKKGESLYQIDVGSGELTLQAEVQGYLKWPEWSPDGATVFYRWNDLNTDYYIIARDLRANAERRIYRVPPSSQLEWLALSPDGERIAFVLTERKKGPVILTIPSSGGVPELLVSTGAGEGITALAWAPDGRHLYYGKRRPGARLVELWRVSGKGGRPETLDLALESMFGISFHPHGRTIALAAGEYQEEIWVLENFLPRR